MSCRGCGGFGQKFGALWKGQRLGYIRMCVSSTDASTKKKGYELISVNVFFLNDTVFVNVVII